MTAATFDCPHCGAKYPLKPVLIGKTVRCTSCKNAFRLREDGLADKVETPPTARVTAPAPVPVPAPAPAPVAAAPVAAAPAAPRPVTPAAPAPAKKPEDPPSARLQTTTPKAGLTRQQLEARKAMADSLKATMDDALGLDEVEPPAAASGKPGTERKSKPGTERSSKSSNINPASKKPGKSPAILTNEGEREAANSRRWLIGGILVALVVGLLIMVASREDERSAAVAAFTAELPANERRYGARIEAIQARGWIADITPFIDLPAPRLSSQRQIPAASLEPLTKLKGLTYVAVAERWVTPGVAAWLAKQPPAAKETFETKLERDGAIQVTVKSLRKALAAANLGDDEMTIVMRLLTQPTATANAPKFAELLAQGRLPTIHWCTVSGRKGLYLIDPGQGYRTETADYQGFLMSFSGEGWPSGWRFMTLAAVK